MGLDVSIQGDGEQILFSVTDTGIGIAPEDLKKLFTPFTQLDSSLVRQYTGTGRGLSLMRKLTELHGGSIVVESEIGKGSRFTVVLPLHLDHKAQAHHDSASAPGKHNADAAFCPRRGVVLLAEDNANNSRMLAEYLENYGYTVLAARNGRKCFKGSRKRCRMSSSWISRCSGWMD